MRTHFVRACVALAVLALTILSTTACSSPGKPMAACGVVVDITNFRRYDTAKSIVDTGLPEFLDTCEWVAYAAVTGNSEGSPCQELSLPLYAETGNEATEEMAHQKLLEEAMARAERLWTCTTDDSKGSDILGALRVVANRLAAAPHPGEHRIAVFSDLMNNTGGLDLSTCDTGDQSARANLVADLKDKQLIADLAGATVDVYGFNLLSERRPECVPAFKSVWKAIFAAAGVGESNLIFH